MGAEGSTVEVFFCSSPLTDKRRQLSDKMLIQWSDLGVRLHVLTPEFLGCHIQDFNRWRRMYADEMALGNYLLVDDDIFPVEPDTIPDAFKILDSHPDFGILSYLPVQSSIQYWTPVGYVPFVDGEVMEHVDVGGMRVCRKGCLPYWPPQPEDTRGYDRTQAEALRRECRRVGYFRNLVCNHFGEGSTDLWLDIRQTSDNNVLRFER